MTDKTRTTPDSKLKELSEAEGWVAVGNADERKAHWKQLAHNTIERGRKRISISVREDDLARLKSEALRSGIPYQTIINNLIRTYVRKD